MSTPPAASRPLPRAALVVLGAGGVRRSIPFQYNPDSLRRTLEPNTVGGRPGQRSQAVRFAGAPVETIALECRFSAADGLDAGDPVVAVNGIGPQLAALSLLAYPATQAVQQAQSLLDQGRVEVAPPPADRVLLVWGPRRVIPVAVTSLAITEQLHDTALNPVLATVQLTLRALSYSDVDSASPSFQDFMAYQQGLEQLGALVR